MNAIKTTKQVISKKRVADHGEVLTAEREVNDMLRLVQNETERIDSRFLEPACGTGNFLAPILERKLAIVANRYAKSQLEFERYAIVAVGSIYGIDILEDNVRLCRDRLLTIFNEVYSGIYKKRCKEPCREVACFILNKNILWGDALSLRTVAKQSDPITFSEWSLVRGSMVKRRDYTFADLLSSESANTGLFGGLNVAHLDAPIFIPKPAKEYPLKHFLELVHEDAN